MEGLEESIGQLSTNAKEWKPGQGFTTSSSSSSDPSTSNKPVLNTKQTAYQSSNSAATITLTSLSKPASSTSRGVLWGSGATREFVPKSTPGLWKPSSTSTQQQLSSPTQPSSPLNSASKSLNPTTSVWSNPNPVATLPNTNYSSHWSDQSQNLSPVTSNNGVGSTSGTTVPAAWAPQPQEEMIPSNLNATTEASVPAVPFPSARTATYITPNNNQSNVAQPLDRPHARSLHSLSLPSHALWEAYRDLALDRMQQMEPNDARYKAIPPTFTNAMPLDRDSLNNNTADVGMNKSVTNRGTSRSSFGYPTTTFKVMNEEDGRLYCLRRFDNVRCVNHKIAEIVTDIWNRATIGSSSPSHSPNNNTNTTNVRNRKYLLQHPGIVRFYKCFYSAQNRAVFFMHEYYPGAQTLREQVHGQRMSSSDVNNTTNTGKSLFFTPLSEEIIWSYIAQLVSTLRAVHRSGLACRILDLGHVLCTPDLGGGFGEDDDQGVMRRPKRIRLRINCLGVSDALEFEARKQLSDLQKEDMRCLGRLILSLATGTEIGGDVDGDTLTRCDIFVRQNNSPELHNLAMALIARGRTGRLGGADAIPMDPPKIQDVCRAVADRAFDELDNAHAVVDGLDEALTSEFESGRALRLLLKLGFVNERPEFGVDSRWSETGDCYVLKLFRDYVFHQADASGRPVMDLGHVITALNKLDSADEEKIILSSRDGNSLLVASYAEVARCLENSYAELCAGSVLPSITDSQGAITY